MELKFKNDKSFEEGIVQALIFDHTFAEQMVEVLNVEYFNVEYLREVVGLLFSYYNKYRAFPSYRLLGSIVLNEIEDGTLKDQIKVYLLRVKKEPLNNDIEYIKETSLDFCRKRSLALALEASLDLIEEKKYEQISTEIKKALQAGAERSVGHNYKDQFELRMQVEAYDPVPTPYEEINKRIRGGLGKAKVGVIAALTGVGKSHSLVDIGAHAIMNGFNVAHYTLEDSDIEVGRRYDSRVSSVCVDNLHLNKDLVSGKIKEKVKGELIIKSYPAGTSSVLTLRNHYNNLILRNIRPDLIIVDYAELLKSSEHDAKRHNIESAFRELVAWAAEIATPIWTAAQINRAGLDVEILTHKYLHECFAIAQIVHLFLTINRKKDGPNPELGNMHIAKSKIGWDGVTFPMMINTGISRLEILPPEEYAEANTSQTEDGELKRLQNKFKAFKDHMNSKAEGRFN
jgi:replicative DNA helicase